MKASSPIEIFLAIVLLLTVILLLSLALIPRKLPAIWVLSIAAKAVPDADLTNTAPPLPRTVRLRVIEGEEPPAGWLGKPSAMQQAFNHARAEWILAEDADMIFDKAAMRTAVDHTLEKKGDAITLIPHFEAGSFWERRNDTVRQILEGEKPANSAPIRVDMTPGAKFRYAGGAYVILQQLMMDVSGKSFPESMQKTLLQRLGMTHRTFQQPLSPDLASRAAAGHLPNGQEIKGKWFVLPELAPAGLWTTPTDLARFVIEVQKSRLGRSNKVLSAARKIK